MEQVKEAQKEVIYTDVEAYNLELKNQTEIFMLSSTLCVDEINQCKRNPYVEDVFSKPLPIEKFMAMICPPLKHQA